MSVAACARAAAALARIRARAEAPVRSEGQPAPEPVVDGPLPPDLTAMALAMHALGRAVGRRA